jgi:hypothetical protein
VQIGTNATLRSHLRQLIAERKHMLFNRLDVIEEWVEFLQFASLAPRPTASWWNVDEPLRAVDLFGTHIQAKFDEVIMRRALAVAHDKQLKASVRSEPIKVTDAIGGAAVGEVELKADNKVKEQEQEELVLLDGGIIKNEHPNPVLPRMLSEISIRIPNYEVMEETGDLYVDTDRIRPIKVGSGEGIGWHWSKRSWGWEVVGGDALVDEWPNEKANGLQYALKLSHTNESTQESFTFLVEVEGAGCSCFFSFIYGCCCFFLFFFGLLSNICASSNACLKKETTYVLINTKQQLTINIYRCLKVTILITSQPC